LTEVLGGVLQRPNRSEALLQLEVRALAAITEDEGFSDDELGVAGMVIEGHPSRANMYLSLKTKGVRTSYIRRQMKMLTGDN
jgi:hypothetical protein